MPFAWDGCELVVVTRRHSTFHRRIKSDVGVLHLEWLRNAAFDETAVGLAHSFLEDMAEQPVANVRVFVFRPDIARKGEGRKTFVHQIYGVAPIFVVRIFRNKVGRSQRQTGRVRGQINQSDLFAATLRQFHFLGV